MIPPDHPDKPFLIHSPKRSVAAAMVSTEKTLVDIVTELAKAETAKTLEDLKVDSVKEARKAAKAKGQKFWILVPGAEERAIAKVVEIVTKAAKELVEAHWRLESKTPFAIKAGRLVSTLWRSKKEHRPEFDPILSKALGTFGISIQPDRNFVGWHEAVLPELGPEEEAKLISVPEIAEQLLPIAEFHRTQSKAAHDKTARELNVAASRLFLLEAAARSAPKRQRPG